ncbi:MAG: M48 family metalloprotease [Phycisphaerales bacterium]
MYTRYRDEQAMYRSNRGPQLRISPRLVLAAVIAIVTLIGYYSRSSHNPITGRTQRVALSPAQEIALGLQSAPEMARQFGGLSADRGATALVESIGAKLVAALPPEAHPYPFQYHLLADRNTVNAFALPGGQIFITEALYSRLKTEGQLAGVLGHETGHVLARHSAEQMAKTQLAQGLVGAAGTAASDYGAGGAAQQTAAAVAQFSLMKYGRNDEIEADALGLRFMHAAGYDPRALIGVMRILAEASGGSDRPEFMSTHPNPGNRIEQIENAIAERFPRGVPDGLVP